MIEKEQKLIKKRKNRFLNQEKKDFEEFVSTLYCVTGIVVLLFEAHSIPLYVFVKQWNFFVSIGFQTWVGASDI